MGNTFTRPPKVLGGNRQAISAKDFNALSRAIEELQNAIPAQPAQQNRPSVKMPPAFWGTVSQVPQSDPPEYQATFTLGFLTYQNAGASESEQGVTGYIVPKIKNDAGELISMDAEAPIVVPAVALPDVVSFVYLRVKTDADGAPKFDGESVTIEAFAEAQQSVHHVRPSPSGGEEEGDYYFLLLETESNEATPTPAPRAKRRITGNRNLPNQLVEITNIGGKREIYEGYLPGPDDKHQFRSLEQLEDGNGYEAPVIKALQEGEEEGDTIPFVGLGVLQPQSGDDKPTRPANFEASGDNKVSLLNFTGVDGPINIPVGGGVLNFAGGLCTGGAGNGDPGSGEGLWGQIGWQYAPPVGSIQSMILFVENGIIKRVTNTQGVLGDGTEGDPIFTNFQTG